MRQKLGQDQFYLTCSFPYVRDWLNEHPFRNESNASLICNIKTGAPITAEALWTVMKQLQEKNYSIIKRGINQRYQRTRKTGIYA